MGEPCEHNRRAELFCQDCADLYVDQGIERDKARINELEAHVSRLRRWFLDNGYTRLLQRLDNDD